MTVRQNDDEKFDWKKWTPLQREIVTWLEI